MTDCRGTKESRFHESHCVCFCACVHVYIHVMHFGEQTKVTINYADLHEYLYVCIIKYAVLYIVFAVTVYIEKSHSLEKHK